MAPFSPFETDLCGSFKAELQGSLETELQDSFGTELLGFLVTWPSTLSDSLRIELQVSFK